MHDAQIDAMIRWLAFIGLPLSASSVQRSPESSRRSRFRKVLQRVDGVEGFVRGLAAWPPVVLTMTTCSVCSGSGWSPATSSSGVSECWNCEGPLPPIPRERIMQAAISSVLTCLLRAGEITTTDKTGAATIEHVGLNELDFVADLLLERGHAWLGEPLALWLADEREKAVDLLLERVPVLDDYAEWDAEWELEDTFDRADDLARARLAQELGQRVVVLSNPTSDDFYSRLALQMRSRRLTRASGP